MADDPWLSGDCQGISDSQGYSDKGYYTICMAHLSATQGELEVAPRKCKVAEDEAHTICERAQIHFGTDVAPYMTEITHLRNMVGRLSKQVQEQNQQIADQNDELNKVKSDPEMVTARDRVVKQLKDDNERLRQDIEEADIKMKSLKLEVVDKVSCFQLAVA